MKTRRRKLLEDRQTIVGRSNADENSSPMPNDLMYEIFLRLSPKYIARCRCVSKLWSSILDHQDFTDQFLKQSSLRPRLLFVCLYGSKVSFFSSPQPQNPDENTPPTTASHHMSLHLNDVYQIHSPISGLVGIGDFSILNGRKRPATTSVICNPSTGQSCTLPRIKTRKKHEMRSFFGYDPVGKQFKVLSMTLSHGNAISEEHHVLTLETGKLSWRLIECCVPHHPEHESVCIDGVLYYRAAPNMSSSMDEFMIVCFDFRSEKFSFIKATEPGEVHRVPSLNLINYKGKLASLKPNGSNYFSRENTSFEMWVLDDLEKKEWSKHSYPLPPQWQSVVPNYILKCVGVTGSNEIVFSEDIPSNPFYVFYYSLEKETIRRVEIQGMGGYLKHRLYTFLNHVENVKVMKDVL
ncbi:F-box protein DOR [Raphanus sativus]|uniref:F-box protein DOR-like n=1 Tax=Raphanus sativus TaxID=3726 RepID=A0A6J0M6F9_RAPSA|nr:F-box protein DOR-like [Raphanus sativus]KAJ4911673.1 F-box protein DOR [Raphanus sativus]